MSKPQDQAFNFTRRDVLAAGVKGAFGALVAGSILGRGARALAGDGAAALTKAPPRSVIFVFLPGGPSHIDTFDPKPGAATGGPFKALQTSADGIRISEHLPRIASHMKHLSLINSMSSKEGSHQRARHLIQAGYAPAGPVRFPSFGAVVARERTPRGFALPAFVAIGQGRGAMGGGYLGARYSPFVVGNPGNPIPNLEAPANVDAERLSRRRGLLFEQEEDFAGGRSNKLLEGHRQTYERTHAFMGSEERKAFDLAQEKAELRRAYGQNRFGQSCLMARRLVEVGVPFINVSLGGWDTHRDNFNRVQALSKTLDDGLGQLIQDLRDRDLLASTLILCCGEFGRTPRINANTGRDHWPRAFSALIGGGGIAEGQLIGATDPTGGKVVKDPVAPRDLFATLAARLGLNRDKVYQSDIGRPFRIVEKEAKVVEGLL